MKKFIALILTLFVVFTVGCQSETLKETNKTTSKQKELTQENTNVDINQFLSEETLTLEGEIKKVTLLDLITKEKVNFEDSLSKETFTKIITNAVRVNGIADMSDPEFKIKVIFTNDHEQSFYIWVNENSQNCTLMKVDDTHTIYIVLKENSGELIELINEHLE